MKPIVHIPHPVLTRPAENVTVFDSKLTKLIEDMKVTLNNATDPKGVGLAATQIGVGLKVFLTKPTEHATIRVFINPEIIQKSDELTHGVPERNNKLEGCLSIPNIWGNVKRTTSLTLRYQDETGKPHEEEFKGFIATIIQHETDHCNGILFTQRVIEQKEKLFQVVTDEKGEEVLEEIKII